jgi:hypothetical protein
MSAIDTLPIEGTRVNWVDELPADLPGATRFGAYLQTCPGDALFEYPHVGRFRVRDGSQIDIQLAAGCTRERALSLARIAPFGCLVHQRRELPLHASTVMRPEDGKVLLIAGASGAGKSTTAAAFAQRGWKILNDDLSRLTIAGADVLVWPGFHSLKLWDRSCRLLNIDRSPLPATGEVKQKYFWTSDKVEGSRAVSAIVELHRDVESDSVLERISGSAAVEMLLRQTFRPRLVRALGLKEVHFTQVVRAARQVPCFRFRNGHTLAPLELAEYLETSVD